MTLTRSRARAAVAGAVLAIAITALVAVVVVRGGDDDPDRPLPSDISVPEADPSSGLDDAGSELVALLEAGRQGRHHARYELSGDELEGESTIEVWRDGDRVRQETELRTADGEVARTAAVTTGDTTVACSRVGEEPWSCAEAETETAEDSSGDVFGTVEQQLRGVEVAASDDEVAGRQVRCFEFSATDGAGRACVTPDGVPVLVSIGSSEIRLAALDDDVPGDVFTPPAG